jgi:hypothetical protein
MSEAMANRFFAASVCLALLSLLVAAAHEAQLAVQ